MVRMVLYSCSEGIESPVVSAQVTKFPRRLGEFREKSVPIKVLSKEGFLIWIALLDLRQEQLIRQCDGLLVYGSAADDEQSLLRCQRSRDVDSFIPIAGDSDIRIVIVA